VIQACLNGTRSREDHPAVPITPSELARDAAACVAAGAESVHVHPRDADGRETLAVDDAVRALRAVDVEVSVSTGAWIPGDRLAAVAAWRDVPDVASVNVMEEGWRELCEALLERGVGIELGLASVEDAEAFIADPVYVHRVLVEVPQRDDEEALTAAATIDGELPGYPRLWHGEESATWAVVREGLRRGRDVRIGLEDVLEDDNPTLVRRVVELAAA
jgi:uncharacterized protein (DUF849 family)